MRRGVCVKCGAATVRAARNGIETGQVGESSVLRPDVPPDFRGMAHPHRADLWCFCCTTCGYLELHLPRPEDMAFVAQHWTAIPPTAQVAPDRSDHGPGRGPG